MIFRQFFDRTSSSYSYLLASRPGGEALIIDPVLDQVGRYLRLLKELDLRLVKAIDTHLHVDHITGLGALRDRTRCITVMGEESPVDVVSIRVTDGERIDIEEISLCAIHTPGHTADSYSFLQGDRLFTGDTLFIRGTGRTDFESGDPAAQYDSLFNKLLRLPDETLVYPGHDYKGDTVSTIGEEKVFNPRLQVQSCTQYVDMMNSLNLPNPKMMDVALPANLKIGYQQDQVDTQGWSLSCDETLTLLGWGNFLPVDLRDETERARHGEVPDAIQIPYGELNRHIGPGGRLRELACGRDRRLIFCCAQGERSAMGVEAARQVGLVNSYHLKGGLEACRVLQSTPRH